MSWVETYSVDVTSTDEATVYTYTSTGPCAFFVTNSGTWDVEIRSYVRGVAMESGWRRLRPCDPPSIVHGVGGDTTLSARLAADTSVLRRDPVASTLSVGAVFTTGDGYPGPFGLL